jgi:hypothetical protein
MMGSELKTAATVSGSETEIVLRKQAYQQPMLVRYGYAKDLTAAGPSITRGALPAKEPCP